MENMSCRHDANSPPGRLHYWNCTWDEKHLGVPRDFKLMGVEKARLLRLRPDCSDDPGWFPSTRTDFMTLVCREALRDGNCEIVGGFIRDWIIRGEPPRDIDIRLWDAFDMKGFIRRCEVSYNLKHYKTDKGELGFDTPIKGEWFLVDYVNVESMNENSENADIDLDVNALAVSTDGGLHKRKFLHRPFCQIYGNIKRTHAYLIRQNPCAGHCQYVKGRVDKMKARGWKIIGEQALHDNCWCIRG